LAHESQVFCTGSHRSRISQGSQLLAADLCRSNASFSIVTHYRRVRGRANDVLLARRPSAPATNSTPFRLTSPLEVAG
jgi:hypothetical protein